MEKIKKRFNENEIKLTVYMDKLDNFKETELVKKFYMKPTYTAIYQSLIIAKIDTLAKRDLENILLF